MGVELTIRWDGQVRGLVEQRLSVECFALPLSYLLADLRRTARNIVSQWPEKSSTTSVGRFTDFAARIDIEVQEILKSSIGINGLVLMKDPLTGAQPSLPFSDDHWTDFLEHITDQTLQGIDRERRGIASDHSIRKYLGSLPSGITRQEYTLRSNGCVKRKVSFGEFELHQRVDKSSSLREIEGRVTGVRFHPGACSIKIKGNGKFTIDSTPEAVEKSLTLRGEDVRVLYVVSGRTKRLLKIEKSNQRTHPLDTDMYVFEKWSSVIKALAK